MDAKVRAILRPFNTHAVSYIGLGTGLVALATAVTTALIAFFKVASDPAELLNLYIAIVTHHDPNQAIVKILGPFIAVCGAVITLLVAAFLITWIGRAPQIQSDSTKDG